MADVPPSWAVPTAEDAAEVHASALARLRARGRTITPPSFEHRCNKPSGCAICDNTEARIRRAQRGVA